MSALKRAYLGLVGYDLELPRLLYLIAGCAGPQSRILDLGCGRGRLLRPLFEQGRAVTGVDANEALVAANRADGLPCMGVAELERGDAMFDVVVMSHLIEHFAPEDLVAFMDRYLDRLREGGSVVIASPLMTPYFHDDLDHVRPYPPSSIAMAFAPGAPQTRHRPRNRLVLRELWFRRAHFRPVFKRGRHLRSWSTWPLAVLEALGAVAFRASFGLIGRTDGWVGVFEKVDA